MPKVLLVEDFEDTREYIVEVLHNNGFTVVAAADGREAIDLASEEHPDLILMDLSLPRLNGWQATSMLKAKPALCQIPIIALTAHALSGDERRAKEVGCDDYIAKPVLPRELVGRINHHLASVANGA